MRKNSADIDSGALRIEPDLLTVTVGDRRSQLTARDMDVLMCLAAAEGRVLPREELLERVWKDVVVNEEVVSLSISRIRSALGESAREPVYIHTIPKKGYRFLVPEPERKMNGSKITLAALAVLLLLMSLLFWYTRIEYGRVMDTHEAARTESTL